MMKNILPFFAAFALVGCTEKTQHAIGEFSVKIENKMVEIAGEGEVAISMYRAQYATLKERLVRLKTLQKQFNEELEIAYSSIDQRRIKMYEDHVKDFNTKISEAESTLEEFFNIFQRQREEIRLLKDEISTFRAAGSLTDQLSVTSEYEKRAEIIRSLIEQLKEKSNRAKSLLEVGKFEEKYTKK